MKQYIIIMGMPVFVEVLDDQATAAIELVFAYLRKIDDRYSTYKTSSEISKINNGLPKSQWSLEMKKVLRLCAQTKSESYGYFDIKRDGKLDPSGLVKGWAITNAASLLLDQGIENFYIDVGGDIEAHGCNADGKPWSVGIRNPFQRSEVIKVLRIQDRGAATSGTYIRGQHIYNPFRSDVQLHSVKSLTVIGPSAYEADRFATAAFAMGVEGIGFIERRPGLEGYMVDNEKIATFTSGFSKFTEPAYV